MTYHYKIAKYEQEFAQIHRLNYETFVQEIPQHEKNEKEILIDQFHNENTYLICLKNDELVGMIAVRDQRPFSLDYKIGSVEKWLPFEANRLCEIRLLAVKKEHRNGRVFSGLAKMLARYCLKKGYDTAVISGTVREQKLYQQMGFQSFAYPVGTKDALFYPMFLTKETFKKSLLGKRADEGISFLPGPIRVRSEVREALAFPAISHRNYEFIEDIKLAQEQLCRLTRSRYVQIMLGTGTLANDVIAAQLKKIQGKGLIIANGEFGERLINHGKRAGLDFVVLRKEWGEAVSEDEISAVTATNHIAWLWFVHCETSTGMLNDLDMVKAACRKFDIKLCVDCISSLGTMPIDLHEVYLASGVSGKGIGAFTGLSFIFHNHEISPSEDIPCYLDLGMYYKEHVPFSHSSNLFSSLLEALKTVNDERYEEIRQRYDYVRGKVEEIGLSIFVPREHSATGILTIVVPEGISSVSIGDAMYLQGYELHYESSYLRKRNWIQIACMGDVLQKEIDNMITCLKELFRTEKTSKASSVH